jgi:hypothetical protein
VRDFGLSALDWPEAPLADPANPAIHHEFRRSDGKVQVATRIGDHEYEAILLYAMGSNHQGRSYLARDGEGTTRELRISRYPAPPVWDRTNQHPAVPADDLGYVGRPLSSASVSACLNCHATNFFAAINSTGRPEGSDHGIGCERCHGPGGNHILAINGHFPELAIARPRLATSEQVTGLCGECHKAPPSTPPDDTGFIRFQFPSLISSRCYTESEGGLSCVTCHNPHRNASRTPSEYEVVCLQCHTPSENRDKTRQNVAARAKTWAPCPTHAQRDCLRCHMPRVPDAVPRTVFTDHFIRIRPEPGRPAE